MRGTLRRGWLAVLVAAVLAAILAELKAQPAPSLTGDDALVMGADEALGQALRTADKSSARRLLSLQFAFVDEDGKLHERKDFLADLKGMAAAPATDPQVKDPVKGQAKEQVKSYGRIAMITGHRLSAHGGDVFFLDIWAKQKGTWRALLMQNVEVGAAAAPSSAAAAAPSNAAEPAKAHDCNNPCETIPYRVRSPIEQDILNSFQAIEKASVAHDADEWSKHVADEFVLYASGRDPIAKPGRIAAIEHQKESNTAVTVGEVQAMRLIAYDNGAAMTSMHAVPDNSRPPYRAARVWVRRSGQWQMAISVQTEIK